MVSPEFLSSANPPYNDRAAEPDACPASRANSSVSYDRSAAPAAATVVAANADAEEASPAAIGKLLWLVIFARKRCAPMTLSRQRLIRGSNGGLSSPFTNNSSLRRSRLNATLTSVYSSLNVIEIEPTAGRFRATSRLPQYLMSAMFGCAIAVACMCLIPDFSSH